MSKLPKQTSHKKLVAGLRACGFKGPYTGTGPHPLFMSKGDVDVKLPNVHRGDIREPLLKEILRGAGISIDKWMKHQ